MDKLFELDLLQGGACGVLDRASAAAIILLFINILYYALKDIFSPAKQLDYKQDAELDVIISREDYGHFVDLEDEYDNAR
jgi:hypothetical protein